MTAYIIARVDIKNQEQLKGTSENPKTVSLRGGDVFRRRGNPYSSSVDCFGEQHASQ